MEDFCADIKHYRPGPDTPFPRHPHDYRYLSQLLILTPVTTHFGTSCLPIGYLETGKNAFY